MFSSAADVFTGEYNPRNLPNYPSQQQQQQLLLQQFHQQQQQQHHQKNLHQQHHQNSHHNSQLNLNQQNQFLIQQQQQQLQQQQQQQQQLQQQHNKQQQQQQQQQQHHQNHHPHNIKRQPSNQGINQNVQLPIIDQLEQQRMQMLNMTQLNPLDQWGFGDQQSTDTFNNNNSAMINNQMIMEAMAQNLGMKRYNDPRLSIADNLLQSQFNDQRLT